MVTLRKIVSGIDLAAQAMPGVLAITVGVLLIIGGATGKLWW